ncbi:OB-fold domain-containing protein [Caldinitratiruptor microaerophilus]|uniref:3-hydroxy-3-methylglutaryl CoA synthase n=1 Tax=Caldinitratiruptor microaerophilus TaxID=671077 RepID=A0AA35CJM4_9FIRM|nr:OB-fold domain-containing protein [Caldinitratiruptor microaerophilus]BDG59573.1 hypothetical protein caldi_06630 [Caldinitratiruptor microaerophilus]
MIGITAYGAYIPYHRLSRKAIAEATGETALPGQRAVAGPDEDSVTMAVEAARDALGGQRGDGLDAVYLATTTAPYREKQAAATVAAALGVRPSVRAAAFSGSLQAGASALLAAVDAVRAGSAGSVLVAVADLRPAAPQGPLESIVGDGAAAFLVGSGPGVLATLEAAHSVTADLVGQWRGAQDPFVRSWEERFVVSEGYGALVREVLIGLRERTGLGPADFARVILHPLHPRHHAALAAGLGFRPEQVQDPLFAAVGLAGAAAAPLMLAAALAQARPGDRLLYVSYGDGADALVFRVTEAASQFRPRRGVAGWLEVGREGLTYMRYLRWRGLVPAEPGRRPARPRPSAPALWRRRAKNLALTGSRCTACGTPQFPPQRVCVHCQAVDHMEPYRFADRPARLVTFTADHLAAAVDPPTLLGAIDFEGGGRMLVELTDCMANELHVGMPVEMTFRRLYEAEGIQNYFWKARPVRTAGEGE